MSRAVEPGVIHETEYVAAGDGERVFVQRWRPATGPARAAMVIAHGLGEHSGRYLPVVDYFVPRGAAVYAHDHRGFGRSEGRRGYVPRYDRYVDDLLPLVERARAENPGLPLVLVGHSMGGTIALLFALRYPDLLSAAVFSAPALLIRRAVSPAQRLGARVMARVHPTYTNRGTIDPTVLTRDPTMRQATLDDPLRHSRVTARLYDEMFERAPRAVFARVGGLRVPFFILHGTDDPLVWPEGSQRVYDAATDAPRAIRLYPGLLHESFNEIERDEVFADIAAWLAARGIVLDPAPRGARAGVLDRLKAALAR